MRAFVFTDRALERHAGRVVWLSINAEKEANAGFLERYPLEAYPTLFVLDPREERAVLRWIGGATVPQIERLLDDGERAFRGATRGVEADLARADRLLADGKKKEAVRAYRKTLKKAPAGWPGRDRAVASLLASLDAPDTRERCIETARREMPSYRGSLFALVSVAGLTCALGLEGMQANAAVEEFEAAVRSALGEPRIEMTADDRSGMYLALVEVRNRNKDAEGAKSLAGDWLAFLEKEAESAPDASARAVFDAHRLSAALILGDPARAIPALERSQTDFPEDYNPPARLALALKEAGRFDEALKAADRALELAYGPRKLRVYSTKADILEKNGELDAARATLREALSFAASLPTAQRSERAIAAIEKRLSGMN